MKELYFSVHGQLIKTILPDTFADFVFENYRLFTAKTQHQITLEIVPEKMSISAAHRFVAPQLWETPHELIFSPVLNKKGMRLTARLAHTDKLHVGYDVSTTIWHRLRATTSPSFRLQTMQRLMRQIIHYPLFFLLEQNGFGFMHAAAVEKNGKAFVFVGANGSGKSTLALTLLQQGYRFLSDNFVLYRESRIYAFPEVVRASALTAEKLGWIPKGPKVFGKYQFPITTIPTSISAEVHAVFFVKPSTRLVLHQTPSQQLIPTITEMHRALGEFHYQSALAPAERLPGYHPITEKQRHQRLVTLLDHARCGILEYDKPKEMKTAIKTLEAYAT